MTIGSHELALTIINDGAGYAERCQIAKVGAMQCSALMAQISASHWLRVATEGARVYERQFGTPATASSFTPEDILLQLRAEYYEKPSKRDGKRLKGSQPMRVRVARMHGKPRRARKETCHDTNQIQYLVARSERIP